MTINIKNSSPNNSSVENVHSNSPKDNMQIFCKQMLKTRVFMGHYQEKRYVESLKSYRDLIVISKNEKELCQDIEIVHNRVARFYQHTKKWMGYTHPKMVGAPAAHCIWTELDNIPFGEYWFQIKTVRFRHEEVIIQLKMLRPNNEYEKCTKYSSVFDKENGCDVIPDDFSALLKTWKESFTKFILIFLSINITAHNMVKFIKMLALVIVGLSAAIFELIKFAGFFTLRFLYEIRHLIYVSTPIILRIIDLISKTIGGFYILVAMIWRQSVSGYNQPQYYQSQLALPAPPVIPNTRRTGRFNQQRF